MKAVSPVVIGLERHESFKGGPRAGQPQYLELPCLLTKDGGVVSRWQPTPEERKWIADGCDVFLTIYCGLEAYPPTSVQVMHPTVAWGNTAVEKAEGAMKHFNVIPLAEMPEAAGMLRNPEPPRSRDKDDIPAQPARFNG
ncbi:MAG TPA: hypothetical protein VN622_08995 [Clostridia bacterium]|nr:hypothetical protein [Clostridia bacterium]